METQYIGWGLLAIINAALANFDGRSPLTYFFGSLFMDPLVTIALATTKYEPDKGLVFIDLIYGRNGKAAIASKPFTWWLGVAIFSLIGFFGLVYLNHLN
jgi:hypothetical protein